MKFSVDGTKFEFDDESLTFEEGDALETVTGLTLSDGAKARGIRFVQAMVWVAMRRDKPELTFREVGQMAIGAVEFEDEPDADPNPGSVEESPSTPSA